MIRAAQTIFVCIGYAHGSIPGGSIGLKYRLKIALEWISVSSSRVADTSFYRHEARLP